VSDFPGWRRGQGRADRISISLPHKLTDELRAHASDQGRSLSNLCGLILEQWLEQRRTEH